MALDFTALVENVITCPVCLKHFDQPRMLPCSHTFCFQCIQQMTSQNNGLFECPKQDGTEVEGNNIGALPVNKAVHDLVQLFDHPDSSSPLCHRCVANVAEHWCDSDCNQCFCSTCWESIHEVGQYRNHTKRPAKDKPSDVPKCQEHGDDKLTYWCEKCTKEICTNCQQFQHKDHPFVLVTGYVKSLEEQTENGLQGVQLCLNYRSNRVENMITEIGNESESNQTKVTTAMASLRRVIDERERVLLENIRDVEKDQKKQVEDYKRLLQGEQQNLIEEVLNFVVVCKDKQPRKLLDAKQAFQDYMKRADLKLLELKPLTRTENYIPGLDKLNDVEAQIQNIKVERHPKHQNQALQDRIARNPDKSTLNLANLTLNNLDMEIVAAELEMNRTLTTLQLYANQISDIGARHLADALRMNKTLTDLQLYNNQIGSDGLEHFADALRTNKTLSSLTMYHNQIKDEAARYIADGLKVNKEMEDQVRKINVVPAPPPAPVPVYENPQLQKRIADNRNKATLNFSSSNYTDQDMEIVARELKTNNNHIEPNHYLD